MRVKDERVVYLFFASITRVVCHLLVFRFYLQGGMKAVLWTDSFQVIMMIVSLLAILIQGAVIVGGWGPAWDSALRTNRVWFTECVIIE